MATTMSSTQRLSFRLITLFVVVAVAGCGSSAQVVPVKPEQRVRPHETLNATAWMQLSAEYEALAIQAYNSAGRFLSIALADSSWTAIPSQRGAGSKPPAIIVDVDETVLDNSPFEVRVIRADTSYNRSLWNEWVEERRATAIPGAVEFLQRAASEGVTIFYVTNRSVELDQATLDNLVAEGFPVRSDIDVVLTRGDRPEWTGDKSTRRDFVAEEFRVLFLGGDDLNDFVPTDDLTIAERAELVTKHSSYWGERWVVLPNPSYGSWERTITSAAGSRLRDAQIRAKVEALRDR